MVWKIAISGGITLIIGSREVLTLIRKFKRIFFPKYWEVSTKNDTSAHVFTSDLVILDCLLWGSVDSVYLNLCKASLNLYFTKRYPNEKEVLH